MSLTIPQICNIALGRIGIDQQISAITDTSLTARTCNLHYEQARDEVLMAHNWGFAERRETLAPVTGTAPLPWTYQYRYPAACLRAIRFDTSVLDFSVSLRPAFELSSDATGRLIYADWPDAVLVYTARITDPNQFAADFASALAWKLAIELAMPLAKSPALRDNAEQHYLLAIQRATTGESAEFQDHPFPASSFEQARS